MHLFGYFIHVNFVPFSLPLGVRDWLQLVIVALTGLFNLLFVKAMLHVAWRPTG